jgi:fatty acid desaturase
MTALKRRAEKRQTMRYIIAMLWMLAGGLLWAVAGMSGLTMDSVVAYMVACTYGALIGRGLYIGLHKE